MNPAVAGREQKLTPIGPLPLGTVILHSAYERIFAAHYLLSPISGEHQRRWLRSNNGVHQKSLSIVCDIK